MSRSFETSLNNISRFFPFNRHHEYVQLHRFLSSLCIFHNTMFCSLLWQAVYKFIEHNMHVQLHLFWNKFLHFDSFFLFFFMSKFQTPRIASITSFFFHLSSWMAELHWFLRLYASCSSSLIHAFSLHPLLVFDHLFITDFGRCIVFAIFRCCNATRAQT